MKFDKASGSQTKMTAELLESRRLPHPDSHGHMLKVDHIGTKHGHAIVKSIVSEGAAEEFDIVGGLLSGASYENAACAGADMGRTSRTIRHGNHRFRGVMEADAEEVAGAIQVLDEGQAHHIIVHSKAARVGPRAILQLPRSIDVRSITFVNPAFEKVKPPSCPAEIWAIWAEQALVGMVRREKMARAARGVMYELTHRPFAVIGEMLDLLHDDDNLERDMKELHNRGIELSVVIGNNDAHVPEHTSEAALERYRFDRIIRQPGRIRGGHFGILAVDSFMQEIYPVTEAA